MKKLTKSRKDSVIMGVCGGIGEYFNIDPIIVRIVWVLSLIPFFFGSAVFYVVCGIIIPDPDDNIVYEDEVNENRDKNSSILIGSLLVVLGLFFLAREFVPNFMNVMRLWPALLIIAGIYIIFNKRD